MQNKYKVKYYKYYVNLFSIILQKKLYKYIYIFLKKQVEKCLFLMEKIMFISYNTPNTF